MTVINDIDSEMELISYLYSYMDDEDKDNWSLEAAEYMVADQNSYEISHGITPRGHSAIDFFEVIAEFIAHDSEN